MNPDARNIPGERFRAKALEVISPGAPPQEQKTKLRIFLAAAQLFSQRGYNGTAVREIVELAGVTKPTLYYYFKNKEDVYIKLMDSAFAVFSQVLEESVRRSGSMRQRLVALFTSIFQLFEEYVDLVRLVNSTIYGPRGATPDYDLDPGDTRIIGVFTDILRTGEAEGELDPQDRHMVLVLLLGLFRSMQLPLLVEPAYPVFSQMDIPRLIDLVFDGARHSIHGEAAGT